jgi:hypothetical protein
MKTKTGFSKPPLAPPYGKDEREVIVFQKRSKKNLESRHIEGGQFGIMIIRTNP